MADHDPLAALRQPRRRLRGPFMLTPLIDVLFLLLIFFMLSSQTSPFAMLPVSTAREAVETATTPAASGTLPQLLVQIDSGRIIINGQPFDAADTTTALSAFEPASPVVVLIGATANVQDAVHLLEDLSIAGFSQVRVAARGGS